MSQVFERSAQLKEIVFDVKLRIPEWKVLFAVDGRMDSQGIAELLDLQESDVQTTLAKLRELQLVSPLEMLEETPAEEAPAIEFDDAGASEAALETAEQEPAASEAPSGEAAPAAESAQEESAEEESDIFDLAEEVSQAAPEEDSLDADLEALFQEETAEAEPKRTTEGSESTENDDLDALIGNLLDEESLDDAGVDDTETLEESAPGEAADSSNLDDFDLGSIFDEDLAEMGAESVEDVLDTLEEEPDIARKTAPETPPTEAPELPDEAGSGTILVVDDSVVIRKMVEIALENEDYNIVSVATGKDALNYLDEHTPDLIILDIMLSDVNGLDVLKAIKASKQIPVVMLSAKDTPRETTKAKQLGADDFIPKPFKDEELVGKIKELIKK